MHDLTFWLFVDDGCCSKPFQKIFLYTCKLYSQSSITCFL